MNPIQELEHVASCFVVGGVNIGTTLVFTHPLINDFADIELGVLV